MDITYHYPPELFTLVVQTLPLLWRSKKSLLLFFRGAGVPNSLINDLWLRVEHDKDSINKYEITEITIMRLNELGEQSLRERREILKRITEIEDFSICWPADQFKAMGLVTQIRKIINVKDSFTRMHQEAEKERQGRQDEQRAKLDAKKRKEEELATIKNDLFALFAIPNEQSQKRGKLLEGVLNRLFKAYDILVREAFVLVGQEGEGIVEQIDGVIEITGKIYLVEMKWWKSPLGVGEVAPHLVRIYGREGAGGIFISNSGFTDPAITSCKDALQNRVITLCELHEIVMLLERQGSLAEFLNEKIQHAIIDKQPFHKIL